MIKYLVLDSRNRDIKAQDTHNYFISLSENIKIEEWIILLYASIPFSEFTINEYNNILKINDQTIILDKGFYDVTELTEYLNANIQAQIPSMTLTYLKKELKFKFVDASEFTIDFTNESMNINNLLGFKENKLYQSINNEIKSEKLINLNLPNMINLYIDKFNTANYTDARNIIQLNSFKIPINCNRGGIIEYRNINLNENFMNINTEINNMNVKLLDGIRPFDLNGSDCYFLSMFK